MYWIFDEYLRKESRDSNNNNIDVLKAKTISSMNSMDRYKHTKAHTHLTYQTITMAKSRHAKEFIAKKKVFIRIFDEMSNNNSIRSVPLKKKISTKEATNENGLRKRGRMKRNDIRKHLLLMN